MTKFPDIPGKFCIPEFFRIFRSGTFGKSIRKARAIIIQNFRMIGCIVSEKQGGKVCPNPSIFTT